MRLLPEPRGTDSPEEAEIEAADLQKHPVISI
jgi:hypothetical protein